MRRGIRVGRLFRLHADSHPGVRDLLVKYHLHNFSIFLQQIDGKWYEFGYYEYTGKDFDADMARLAAERDLAAPPRVNLMHSEHSV